MAKPTGFTEFARVVPERRPVQERKGDYREFYRRWTENQAKD